LAVERILRPFIRLLVGRVSCGFLIQQIKRIYIEESRRWIERNDANGRVTKSKLAMLTGLDTRTISAIEAQAVEPEQCTLGDLCAEAGVLHRWMSQAEYHDEDGSPKRLPILGKSGSFQALVSSAVGRNVTYQTVLERLVESGNVIVEEDESVLLKVAHYQPAKSSEQLMIDTGSFSIGRLAETILHNLHAPLKEDRLLQQDRLSRRIPVSALPELKARSRALLEKQIVELEELIDSYEVPVDQGKQCIFGIGWFQFKKC